jgi:hypothetical protein
MASGLFERGAIRSSKKGSPGSSGKCPPISQKKLLKICVNRRNLWTGLHFDKPRRSEGQPVLSTDEAGLSVRLKRDPFRVCLRFPYRVFNRAWRLLRRRSETRLAMRCMTLKPASVFSDKIFSSSSPWMVKTLQSSSQWAVAV